MMTLKDIKCKEKSIVLTGEDDTIEYIIIDKVERVSISTIKEVNSNKYLLNVHFISGLKNYIYCENLNRLNTLADLLS